MFTGLSTTFGNLPPTLVRPQILTNLLTIFRNYLGGISGKQNQTSIRAKLTFDVSPLAAADSCPQDGGASVATIDDSGGR